MKQYFGKNSIPSWAMAVIGALYFVYTLIFGGVVEREFTAKDGSVIKIKLEMLNGIIDLKDDCKLVKVGDTCTVEVGSVATLVKGPDTVVVPVEPVKTEEVKTDQPVKPLEEVKKEAPVKIDVTAKEVPITEVKKVDPVK